MPGHDNRGARHLDGRRGEPIEFAASEVAIVGSSRLAQPKRIFLGRTANKMMRVLAVPMIVVPRGY